MLRKLSGTEPKIFDGYVNKLLSLILALLSLTIIVSLRNELTSMLVFILSLIIIAALQELVAAKSPDIGRALALRFFSTNMTSGSLAKFSNQAWELVVHVIGSIIGLINLYGEPWIRDTKLLWDPCPSDLHPSLFMKASLMWYMASYLFVAVSHHLFRIRTKFFTVMFFYYVGIIVISIIAYTHSQYRIGMIAYFVHDVTDIFYDLVVMCRVMNSKDRNGFLILDMFHIITAVSWLFLRIRYLSFTILCSYIFESTKYCTAVQADISWRFIGELKSARSIVLYVLIFSFLFIQTCWLYFLMHILVKIITRKRPRHTEDMYDGSRRHSVKIE